MLRNTRRRLIGAASGSVERGDVRRRKRGARRGSTRLKWRRAHVSTPSATTYKWVAQRVQLTVPHGAERHPPRHPSRSAVCSTARRHAPSATRAVAASHGTRTVASNQHEKAAEAAEAAAATTADSTAIVGAIDTIQIGRGDTSAFKNENDLAEKVKTFDQEGIPAVISGRASFSDITISDEETVSFL